jgi:hypothetical protein
MTTKYQTTEYNRFKRVENRLKDVYARTVAFKLPHAQQIELLKVVYASPDYVRLTAYYRGYVAGVAHDRSEAIWDDHLVYMLGPAAGATRQVHTEWTEEMSQLCRVPGALWAGHYWKGADGAADLAHPYTPYAASNASIARGTK